MLVFNTWYYSLTCLIILFLFHFLYSDFFVFILHCLAKVFATVPTSMHDFFPGWLYGSNASTRFPIEGVFILSSPEMSAFLIIYQRYSDLHVCVCVCTCLPKHETARGEDWWECLLSFLKQTLKADEGYQEVRFTRPRLNEKRWGGAPFLQFSRSLAMHVPQKL